MASLALALVAVWWLPLQSQPIVTFYKEWLFAIGLGFCALLWTPVSTRALSSLGRHPLVLAPGATVVVLMLQAVFMEGVGPKAVLSALFAGFFAFAVIFGRAMTVRWGNASLVVVARCILIAALGSCAFAALQLFHVELPFGLSLRRVGDRLFGNVAQANHLADLLWIGCVAAIFLHAVDRLSLRWTAMLVVVLQAVSVFSGSRMVWLYVAVLAIVGAVVWRREGAGDNRRFGAGLVLLAPIYALIVAALSLSGATQAFGVSSAEQRMASGDSNGSTEQRLWFWRAGLDAAAGHPWFGLGPGRFAGHAQELAMQVATSPQAGGDSQAHNVFVQLAAEQGFPLAIFVLGCTVVWLVSAWRASARSVTALGALTMTVPILVHANLEHPLAYLYFLGVLGLLVGHVKIGRNDGDRLGDTPDHPTDFVRFAGFSVLAVVALSYVQYVQVEKAMQVVLQQVGAGAPPQRSAALTARLDAVPSWSLYGDYAELLALVTARPTQANAASLAARCDRSVRFGPAPHLLARCATAFEVAGRSERASWYANSLCKLYPGGSATLIQSMVFVEAVSPAVGNLRSSCVDRVP